MPESMVRDVMKRQGVNRKKAEEIVAKILNAQKKKLKEHAKGKSK